MVVKNSASNPEHYTLVSILIIQNKRLKNTVWKSWFNVRPRRYNSWTDKKKLTLYNFFTIINSWLNWKDIQQRKFMNYLATPYKPVSMFNFAILVGCSVDNCTKLVWSISNVRLNSVQLRANPVEVYNFIPGIVENFVTGWLNYCFCSVLLVESSWKD